MAEKIEDLNLPLAVISRLVKDALPAGAGNKNKHTSYNDPQLFQRVKF